MFFTQSRPFITLASPPETLRRISRSRILRGERVSVKLQKLLWIYAKPFYSG